MSSLRLLLFAASILCILQRSGLVSAVPVNHRPVHSNESPTRINDIVDLDPKYARRAMHDVKTTIAEVQKILESNPNLPRLTRGEIEELFETVTREEFEKSMSQGDHNRAKHMRALMVVLPYNTNDMSDDRLQELYTRPPVTRVVSDDSKMVRPQQIVVASNQSKGNKATTYKPTLITKKATEPAPTTFHPKSNTAQLAEIISTRIPPLPSPTTPTRIPTTTSSPKPSTNHYTDLRPAEPNLPAPAIRPKVKDLLATIGLTAEVMPAPSTQPPPPELTDEMRDLLNSFGLLTNEAPPKNFQFPTGYEVREEFEPIHAYNYKLDDTFHVDEVTPIQTSSDEATTQHYRMNTAPELFADDYYAFKPLPIPEEEVITPDMENFFKSYGLLDSTYRNQKSMFALPAQTVIDSSTLQPNPIVTMQDIPDVRVDFLPPDLKSVLDSLGISTGDNYIRRSEVSYIPPVQSTRKSDADKESLTSIPNSVSTKIETTIPTRTTNASKTSGNTIPTRNSNLASNKLTNIPSTIVPRNNPSLTVKNTTRGSVKATSLKTKEDIPAEIRESPTKPTPLQSTSSTPLSRTRSEATSTLKASSTRQTPVFTPSTTTISRRSDVVTSPLTDSPTKPSPVFTPASTSNAPSSKVFVVGSTTATKPKDSVSIVLPTPQINILMDQAVNAKPSKESVVGKVQPMDEISADFVKLQSLLETIKRLDKLNRTLTNEDLDAIDFEKFQLSKTLLDQTKGPDPVVVVNSEFDIAKNEVKRQSDEDKSSGTPLRITLNLGATTEEGVLEKDLTTTKAPFIVMASSPTKDSATASSGDLFVSSPNSATSLSATKEDSTVNDSSSSDSSPSKSSSSNTPSSDTSLFSPSDSSPSDSSPSVSSSLDDDFSLSDDSSTTTTTTTTTTTPKPTLLTNERKNSLEDSFPGGLDPVTEEPLPPPRRNGFYFFSDWNSFLEVGEDPDKVVVRFDPKVGDPSRFIPVEIPSKSFR